MSISQWIASSVPAASPFISPFLGSVSPNAKPPFIVSLKLTPGFIGVVMMRSPVLFGGFSAGGFPPYCWASVGVGEKYRQRRCFSNEVCPVRIHELTTKEAPKTQHRIPPFGKSAGIRDLHGRQ